MLITGLIVLVILITTTIFLWRTALSGISFFFVVYRNEEDMKKLKRITHMSFALGTLGIIYLGGLITYLIMV